MGVSSTVTAPFKDSFSRLLAFTQDCSAILWLEDSRVLNLSESFRLLASVTQGPSVSSLLKDTVWWHGSQEERLGNLFNLLDFFYTLCFCNFHSTFSENSLTATLSYFR